MLLIKMTRDLVRSRYIHCKGYEGQGEVEQNRRRGGGTEKTCKARRRKERRGREERESERNMRKKTTFKCD